jgi:F420-non-reducing hydrogenase iron-sulfur subunit
MGLEPERIEMYFMTSAEADKFVAAAQEMHQRAKELGPPFPR